MRVTVEQNDSKVIFELKPDDDDISHLSSSKISLANTTATIDLGGLPLDDIHPDLIGLSAILMCHQFVGKELHLPTSVSTQFLEKSNGALSKYKIRSGSDSQIISYQPPLRSRPGLAFSGGADSTAALSVMPGTTIPVFMNRPMRDESIYDSDASLKNCGYLREIGYDMKIIDCDVEFLRHPVGFPSDLAHAIPCILLSESLGLDSIAFGTVLESAYGIGHKHYLDYANRSHRRFYGSLLEAAGLHLSLPVSGVSEVGTSIIVNSSPLGDYCQSCIRGKLGKPCMRCWKCFRKELLSMALNPDYFVDLRLMMMKSSEIQIRLSAYPISHENVVTFSIQNINIGDYPYLRHLRNRLDTSLDLSLLRRWYSPSIDLVPEKYRVGIKEKIRGFLAPMNELHENVLTSWNMDRFLKLGSTKKSHFELTSSWQDL